MMVQQRTVYDERLDFVSIVLKRFQHTLSILYRNVWSYLSVKYETSAKTSEAPYYASDESSNLAHGTKGHCVLSIHISGYADFPSKSMSEFLHAHESHLDVGYVDAYFDQVRYDVDHVTVTVEENVLSASANDIEHCFVGRFEVLSPLLRLDHQTRLRPPVVPKHDPVDIQLN